VRHDHFCGGNTFQEQFQRFVAPAAAAAAGLTARLVMKAATKRVSLAFGNFVYSTGLNKLPRRSVNMRDLQTADGRGKGLLDG
jgi:hypothetical protein